MFDDKIQRIDGRLQVADHPSQDRCLAFHSELVVLTASYCAGTQYSEDSTATGDGVQDAPVRLDAVSLAVRQSSCDSMAQVVDGRIYMHALMSTTTAIVTMRVETRATHRLRAPVAEFVYGLGRVEMAQQRRRRRRRQLGSNGGAEDERVVLGRHVVSVGALAAQCRAARAAVVRGTVAVLTSGSCLAHQRRTDVVDDVMCDVGVVIVVLLHDL